jgi:hypothetical protein
MKEVEIPRELARISGVFMDIIDRPAVPGTEPVYYSASPG